MVEISIFDLTIFDDVQFKQISKAMILLNLLVAMSDEFNVVKVKKNNVAQALNCSIRTVTSWIYVLCGAGAIKYKYTGEYMVNPKFYFKGSSENYDITLSDWKAFKCDVMLKRR